MADDAVKSFEFQLAAVYAPSIAAERIFFFQQLALFLDNLKWIVLMGDWNVILDPKIYWVRSRAKDSGIRESNLIDFMACHDLVDRFCLDHLRREMWMWLDSLPSVCARSYPDRVLGELTLILLSVPYSIM